MTWPHLYLHLSCPSLYSSLHLSSLHLFIPLLPSHSQWTLCHLPFSPCLTHIQRPQLNGIYNDLTLGPLCVNDLQPLPAQTHTYWQTKTYTLLLLCWDKVRGVNISYLTACCLGLSANKNEEKKCQKCNEMATVWGNITHLSKINK